MYLECQHGHSDQWDNFRHHQDNVQIRHAVFFAKLSPGLWNIKTSYQVPHVSTVQYIFKNILSFNRNVGFFCTAPDPVHNGSNQNKIIKQSLGVKQMFKLSL